MAVLLHLCMVVVGGYSPGISPGAPESLLDKKDT